MQIRRMETKDIGFALSLTSREGWSDIKSDFEMLIRHSPPAAYIGTDKGQRIAMISAVAYGASGFIGSLIVLAGHRHRGVGTNLMQFAIEFLQGQGVDTIMLDAVPQAEQLYRSLGFRPLCKSLRFSGIIEGRMSENIRHISSADLPHIIELDKTAFGSDRSHFLGGLLRDFPDLCYVLIDGPEIMGFALASARASTVRIAPWIMAKHHQDAGDIIRAISVKTSDKPLSLGVLESNRLVVELCRDIGLRETEHSIRMARSEGTVRPFSEMEYAIGSPAKG